MAERSRAAELSVFAAILTAYALLVRRFWFVADDAFISFRYGRNWVEGHGLVYNPGDPDPVEGYSNFLWTLWSGLIQLAGGDVTVWVPATSFALGALLLYLVYSTLLLRLDTGLVAAALATLGLAVFPPLALWSSGGLATVPFALAAFASFALLVLRVGEPAPVAAGLAGAALVLLRSEGVAFALLIVASYGVSALLSRRARPLRTAAAYLAIVLTVFAMHLALRHASYGTWLPHTAGVKVHFSPVALERGWNYSVVYVLTFLTPVLPLLALPLALSRERRTVAAPLLLFWGTTLAYPVVVGGDWMAMGRLFVVGLPFAALLLGLLLDSAFRRWPALPVRGLVALAALGSIVVGLLPAWNVHLVPRKERSPYRFRLQSHLFRSEYKQWVYMKETADEWSELGRAARRFAQPGDSLVSGAIGAVGFYSGLDVYDTAGLVTRAPETARVDLASPGHDLVIPVTAFLDREPTFLRMELLDAGGFGGFLRSQRALSQNLAKREHYYAPKRYPLESGRNLAVLRRVGSDEQRQQLWSE